MTGIAERTTEPSIAYAVRELGRRAGASPGQIAHWRLHFRDKAVDLYPCGNSRKRIRFPYDASKPVRAARLYGSAMSRYTRMALPGNAGAAQTCDALVPFEDDVRTGAPLFRLEYDETIVCQGDVLTAALWQLSRLEEHGPAERDEHGRFPARASLAWRTHTLERPLVDEYGMLLEEALRCLMPAWKPLARDLRVKISHDIDLVGIPRSARTLAGHLLVRRLPGAFVRDALSWCGIGTTAYLQAVTDIARASRERDLDSAFYWSGSTRTTPQDAGYDLRWSQIRRVLEHLGQSGFELGLHPAYESYDSPPQLERELASLASITGSRHVGGRQHYLRWRPATWKHWEDAGLVYDSSVGFADRMGFRAGTAYPYHPWLLDEHRESPLLEIPLVVMDCTPFAYMGLNEESALAKIAALVERCRTTGGVFTLLWHNTSFIEAPYARVYPRILDLLAGARSYRFEDDLHKAPLPGIIATAQSA